MERSLYVVAIASGYYVNRTIKRSPSGDYSYRRITTTESMTDALCMTYDKAARLAKALRNAEHDCIIYPLLGASV